MVLRIFRRVSRSRDLFEITRRRRRLKKKIMSRKYEQARDIVLYIIKISGKLIFLSKQYFVYIEINLIG